MISADDVLSATDRAFLDVEDDVGPMHVGLVAVLEGAGLVRADGGVDAERVRRLIARGLRGVPRLGQRLVHAPGLGAAWAEVPGFDPATHVRHVSAPRPGTEAQLYELCGHLFESRLDRTRPLWEVWLVEGLAGGRFALVMKAHHAMVDGVGGVGVLASLLRLTPEEDDAATAPLEAGSAAAAGAAAAGAGAPRPPGALEVAGHIVRARVAALRGAAEALGSAVRAPGALLREARDVALGLEETLSDGLRPASRTALNPDTVGLRRTVWAHRLDLGRVRAVKSAHGVTVNDVVLAVVTGALRRHLAARGEAVDAIGDFRALVPVDLRARAGEHGSGNHIALVLARLPIAEPDPRARLRAIHATTAHLKGESHEVEGTSLVERVSDLGGPNLVSATFRIAMHLRAFNVVVTNVPGPPVPLYLGPCRIVSVCPLVPLFSHQGLGVAVLSYDGGLHVGLHADPAAVPDVRALGADLDASFAELAAATPG
jgi:WS/DGAT/MGAT family acyltransferase